MDSRISWFRRARLALAIGLVAAIGAARVQADEAEAQEVVPIPRTDFTKLNHRALAERMGFTGRMRAMMAGRPLEEDRYHRAPPDAVDERNASEFDAWARSAELGEGGEQSFVRSAALNEVEAEDFEAPESGEEYEDYGAEDVLDVEQLLENVEAMIQREELDGRPQLAQTIELGFLDSDFSSVADGTSTTDSRFLRHQAEFRKGLSARNQLRLLSDTTIDKLRDRAALTAGWTRQVERQGVFEVEVGGGLQNSKEGEAEPDHDFYDWQLRGSRVTEKGLNWTAQAYGNGTEYSGFDPFYLDFKRNGAQVEGRYEERGLAVEGRHVYEQDRYSSESSNDVDRLISEIGVGGTLAGADLRYSSRYQREGVITPGDLDAYRQWTTAGTATISISSRLLFETGLSKQSRTVDQVSFFLFDSREYTGYQSVTAFLGDTLSLGVSRTSLQVRNRRKNPLFDETQDDRDEEDYEISATYLGDRVEASIARYTGTVRHIQPESESFANYSREGFSMAVGWALGRRYRVDFNYSVDDEEYSSFVINANRTETSGASLTYTF